MSDSIKPVAHRRTDIPAAVSNAVRERDVWKCQKCLRTKNLHRHHIVAVMDGGSNDKENITLLCDECHLEWHRYYDLQGTPYGEWLAQVPLYYQRKSLEFLADQDGATEPSLRQTLTDIQIAWTKGRSLVLSFAACERRDEDEERRRTEMTDDKVREIRRRWAAGGITQKELAQEFGFSTGTIHGIVHGKTWKHIV